MTSRADDTPLPAEVAISTPDTTHPDLPAPRMAAIFWGEPYDRRTWSSGSYYLSRALERAGVLAGAINGRPPKPVDAALKAIAVDRSRERWMARYTVGAPTRVAASLAAYARGRRLFSQIDATLQVGAYYRLDRLPRVRSLMRTSYHDGNLGVFLRRPDRVLDPGARSTKRAMAAQRAVYDGIDVIFAMSDWLRASFIEDFGQDPGKVVTVGAGANFEDVPGDIPDRSDSPPRFLFTGKNFVRKGGPTLLEAFAITRRRHPDAELWIVGPPPFSAPPGVRCFGYISRSSPDGDAQMARLYRDATAFVLPSVFEPFGWALLEGMSRALPCIGARACAMPEIIDEGRTGLLSRPADAADLAERLCEIADDPQRAAEMGRAGRERFLERFTWDVVARKIGAVVGERLGERA